MNAQKDKAHSDRFNMHFLFSRGALIDCTPGAAYLAESKSRNVTDFDLLMANLGERFRALPTLADLNATEQRRNYDAADDADLATVVIENTGSAQRVVVRQTLAAPLGVLLHKFADARLGRRRLRQSIEMAPCPVWQTDAKGTILNANAAYLNLAKTMPLGSADEAMTVPHVFDLPVLSGGKGPWRVPFNAGSGGRRHWYDVFLVEVDGINQFYALDVDATVNSEVAQRKFVQTLAKTFAQLSTGLAIFDRDRQLALFNPAIIDLTELPAEFLSARPTINAFFDQLRLNSMMPEPKNYATWRDNITRLTEEAVEGTYSEFWTLPSGLTYRVTGRPHPEGALAFLFEDITAEVTLTRGFRAELELGYSVLDSLDDALAIFTAQGVLSFANAAFRKMWGIDPDLAFADISITDCVRLWQTQCRPTPIWGDVRDFIATTTERTEWFADVQLLNGGDLSCRFMPASGGNTLVHFRAGDTKSLPGDPPRFIRLEHSDEPA